MLPSHVGLLFSGGKLHAALTLLAMLIGTTAARLVDPITYLLVLACIAMSIGRSPWWLFVIVALVYSLGFEILIANMRAGVGLGALPGIMILMATISHIVIAILTWGAGVLLRRFASKPRDNVPGR